MIDEQSSASGLDYASDRSAIGAGLNIIGLLSHPQVQMKPMESTNQQAIHIQIDVFAHNLLYIILISLYKRPKIFSYFEKLQIYLTYC